MNTHNTQVQVSRSNFGSISHLQKTAANNLRNRSNMLQILLDRTTVHDLSDPCRRDQSWSLLCVWEAELECLSALVIALSEGSLSVLYFELYELCVLYT